MVNENQTSVFLAYAKFIQATALALGGTEAIVSKDVGDMLEFEIQLAIVSSCKFNYTVLFKRSNLSVDSYTGRRPTKPFCDVPQDDDC